MAAFEQETVLSVHHWNDSLFSFTTTRGPSLRFESGHFVMVGLEVDGKPLLRAYSVASANYEEHLEFFSIKVPNGPLTSRLQHLKVGDEVLVSRKPTGTLVLTDLLPGQHLYLLAHRHRPRAVHEHHPRSGDLRALREGRRWCTACARSTSWPTREFIADELPQHDYLGEQVREQLLYYPTVTREPFRNQGRLTELLDNGKLCTRHRPAAARPASTTA